MNVMTILAKIFGDKLIFRGNPEDELWDRIAVLLEDELEIEVYSEGKAEGNKILGTIHEDTLVLKDDPSYVGAGIHGVGIIDALDLPRNENGEVVLKISEIESFCENLVAYLVGIVDHYVIHDGMIDPILWNRGGEMVLHRDMYSFMTSYYIGRKV